MRTGMNEIHLVQSHEVMIEFDTAADLWVAGRKRGLTPKDADLIIAATPLHHNRVLVTGNTSHFSWAPDLRHENWREA